MSTEGQRRPSVEREELAAVIEARRELGAELEPQLIDAFVERIEQRLDERLGSRAPAKRDASSSAHELALAIVSLCIAIPLLGIAGGTAGVWGVVAVSAALVLVNLVFRR